MKLLITFKLLLIASYLNAAMDCSLSANIGGVQHCPADGSYKTCSVTINNFAGIPEERYFCLSTPTESWVEEASAVFMFHGSGQIGSLVAKHWSNQRGSAFVILPNAKIIGSKRRWNTVHDGIPNFDDLKPMIGHSDTEFVERILQELEAAYSCGTVTAGDACIQNYYATGFSSGAGMTFQLYTRNEFNDWFSGYGPVSVALNKEKRMPYNSVAGTGNATLPLQPRAIMLVIGTEEKVNLPLADIINIVTASCPQPDDIGTSLQCYGNQVNQFTPSNRFQSSLWMRQSNDTVSQGSMSNYDLPTDGTMIASRLYARNPANPNAKAVAIWTVINGAHYWPSINYQVADNKHSEDIETSDELVRFWINEAGFVSNQTIIFIGGFE